MSQIEDASRFLKKHGPEIRPLLDDTGRALLETVEAADVEDEKTVPEAARTHPEILERMLETFETKLFSMDKSGQLDADAKRVFVTMNDPGAYGAIAPLVRGLLGDVRCSGISALASGVAGKYFTRDFGNSFAQIRDAGKTIIDDVLQHTTEKKLSIVITSGSAENGPESLALFNKLGAQKHYHVFDGWLGIGSTFPEKEPDANEEGAVFLDGIFVNDELAKEMVKHRVPGYDSEKILIVGSPVIDSLYVEDSAEFTRAAREKFGLSEDAIAVLFLGDVSSDYKELPKPMDPEFNIKTFEKTRDVLTRLARQNTEKKIALLIRPHLRDETDSVEMLRSVLLPSIPANITIQAATHKEVSIHEALYASDVTMSIASTGNFLSAFIGRKAVFLSYNGRGMGGQVADAFWGKDIMHLIENHDPNLKFANTPEAVARIVENVPRAPLHVPRPGASGSATERTLDIIFDNSPHH